MKPRNWRQYYWYRPRPWGRLAQDRNRTIDGDYIDWLMKARGFKTSEAAWKHVEATQKPCGLISSHTYNAAEAPSWATPAKVRADPVERLAAAFFKLAEPYRKAFLRRVCEHYRPELAA